MNEPIEFRVKAAAAMKPRIILCLMLVLSGELSANARLVRSWSDSELMKASDLVVVATPLVSKDLAETNSLGWPAGGFRGVETTFRVFDALKGMSANDRIMLHHYRYELGWGSLPDGPDLVSFAPNSTNKLVLYLIMDGTNRYAPVTGQADSSFSIRPLPTGQFSKFDMPSVPPMADADPSVRHTVQVHVPLRLHAKHDGNSIKIETDELVVTNLTVGTNMATGTACETKVYQGSKLLNIGGSSLQGGFADGGYSDNLPLDFEKSLKPDESFTVEIKLTMFETDEPAQHFWSPQNGTKYRVLCEQTFKLVAK